MPLIKANNISLAYDGRTVVDNLSFAVSKGDYLCVIGENGSGKSTLIKAFLRRAALWNTATDFPKTR